MSKLESRPPWRQVSHETPRVRTTRNPVLTNSGRSPRDLTLSMSFTECRETFSPRRRSTAACTSHGRIPSGAFRSTSMIASRTVPNARRPSDQHPPESPRSHQSGAGRADQVVRRPYDPGARPSRSCRRRRPSAVRRMVDAGRPTDPPRCGPTSFASDHRRSKACRLAELEHATEVTFELLRVSSPSLGCTLLATGSSRGCHGGSHGRL